MKAPPKLVAAFNRVQAYLKKTRGPVRSAVTVIMAGLAAWLISVLAYIPINLALAKLIRTPHQMGVVSLSILGALSQDLAKGVALWPVGFLFGRFIAVKVWPAAVGLTLVVYLFDGTVSYIIGTFPLLWGHTYALASRLPLLAVIMALTVYVTWWAARLRKKKETPPA